ncbi:MAG: hypothetical protein OXH49_11315 [Gemmatimonadetes bacterium]|nr:hypothetical protein [Gemmatimonadota bacterium]
MHNESSEPRAKGVDGFFRLLNRLLLEARGRPVVQNVFWELAATPRYWTERGSLKPYEVTASRADLVTATGATPDKVRGALAWLTRRGYLERIDTGQKTKAVYRLVIGTDGETPKIDRGVNASAATTSATSQEGESPRLPENPQDDPQDGPKPNAIPGNGLAGSPQRAIPKMIPKVLIDGVDEDPKPPTRECEKTGATTRDARAIQDLPLAERTAALEQIVRPHHTHTEGKP